MVRINVMKNNDFLKLGYKIKYERIKKNLSQMELSLNSGITTRTLSRIECGSIDPRYSTLLKIANSLDIELKDLLDFRL